MYAGVTSTRRAVVLGLLALAACILLLGAHSSNFDKPGELARSVWSSSSYASAASNQRWVDEDASVEEDASRVGGGIFGTWRDRGGSSSSKSNTDEQAYRHHLEETTSPPGYRHSPTLTFSRIYVISLPQRTERRERMRKLGRALGLEFTFVDATDKSAPVIKWIGERVAEVRARKVPLVAKALGVEASQIGGGGIGSAWLVSNEDDGEGVEWRFPPLREDKYDGQTWVEYLFSTDERELRPARNDFDVSAALNDPIETNERRQITDGVVATWLSHMRTMRLVAENADQSALVLEDDVDIEWDIERIWANVHKRLPSDWDTVFLGHCWGREVEQPAYLHPALHQSSQPRCMHGYALSRRGALKVFSKMSDPWVAAQGAVDVGMPSLISRKAINSFSVEPSIIIQTKDVPSDLQLGIGSEWRGVLADSTMERIWRDDGLEVPAPVFDAAHLDPAVMYRGRLHKPEEPPLARLRRPVLASESSPDVQGPGSSEGAGPASGGARAPAAKGAPPSVEEDVRRASEDRKTNPFLGAGPLLPGQSEQEGTRRQQQQEAAAKANAQDGGAQAQRQAAAEAAAAREKEKARPKIGTGGKLQKEGSKKAGDAANDKARGGGGGGRGAGGGGAGANAAGGGPAAGAVPGAPGPGGGGGGAQDGAKKAEWRMHVGHGEGPKADVARRMDRVVRRRWR